MGRNAVIVHEVEETAKVEKSSRDAGSDHKGVEDLVSRDNFCIPMSTRRPRNALISSVVVDGDPPSC